MTDRTPALRAAIENAINCHSAENGSDTPDFILAEYLMDCLGAWDKNVSRREQWYGRKTAPRGNAPGWEAPK